MAPDVKVAVFWLVAPCGPIEGDRRFRGACCLSGQGDECCIYYRPVMEAGSAYEMSGTLCQSTRRNKPEDSHLQVSIFWTDELPLCNCMFASAVEMKRAGSFETMTRTNMAAWCHNPEYQCQGIQQCYVKQVN
jgi:hypothetical protein